MDDNWAFFLSSGGEDGDAAGFGAGVMSERRWFTMMFDGIIESGDSENA